MNIGKIHPIVLDEKTSYLVGVIIGDGHISNAYKSKDSKSKDYRISIEVVDYEFLCDVENLFKLIIKTKSTIKSRYDYRGNRRKLFRFQFRNKSFYYFLTKDLEIKPGNKCNSVKVPKDVFSSLELQKSFLAGLFDTDGGIRGKTIGFTSASYDLIKDISKILNNLKISHFKEHWINKKYDHKYYGIQISKKDIDKFLKGLNFMNKEKLRKVFRHVGVPEWSNGTDDSTFKRELVQA